MKDPVCGMGIKNRGIMAVRGGKTYYFCSQECRNKFLGKEKQEHKEKGKIESISFGISGMHCASCAANIERALKKRPGVYKANINYASEKANVEYDPSVIKRGEIGKIIANLGWV